MGNYLVLVGRVIKEPIIEELGDNVKISTIILAVTRNFKNEEGEYETDFIPVTLFNSIAEHVKEYCKKGDMIGVKGRITKLSNEDLKLVADKVTFLASGKEEK